MPQTETETTRTTPKGAFTEGVALIHRRERDGYHELWMVTASKTLANGDVKVKLLGGHLAFTARAGATFKGGKLPDAWRIFGLTQDELVESFDRAPEASDVDA